MANNNTEQLKDIKPLVAIGDYSIYLYSMIWIILFLIVAFAIFWLFKLYNKSKKINLEKKYLDKLDNIDWSNAKNASYDATGYGRYLANDDRREGIYRDMVDTLDKYKYKKSVPVVDIEDMRVVELYKRVCHESI